MDFEVNAWLAGLTYLVAMPFYIRLHIPEVYGRNDFGNRKEMEPGKKSDNGWKTKLKEGLTWRKELIPIKVIYFLFMGGATGFLPYLTLHMQTLGITVKEIAVIYAFLPIASLLGPPLSGIIADKFGKYKLVVCFNTLLCVVFHVSLLYVPVRPTNSLTFACGPNGHALTWSSCDLCHDLRNSTDLHMVLKNCNFLCETSATEAHLCSSLQSDNSCISFNITEELNINATVLSWRENNTCSHTSSNLTHSEQEFQGLVCPSGCPLECQVTVLEQCQHPDDPSNSPRTFWAYFGLRMISTFFLASAFTMLDATTLAIIKEHKADFGKQRVLATIGTGIVPLITGIILDKHSANIGYTDYMPAFYLGCGLIVIAGLLVTRLQFTVETSSENLMQDLKELVTKVEIDVFLVMVLVLGSNWGFIESYLFVFLRELKAPNYLLGLTLTVGCMVGIPVMFIADKVVEMMGRPAIFVLSFVCYAVRHLGYAYLTDPWLVFPYEMLEVFTYQVMWVAVVTYCPLLAPKGLLATMTGLTGATHYSLGRGVGALFGGYLISNYGLSAAFRIFAYISLAGAALYIFVYYVYLKRKMAEKEKELNAGKKQGNSEEGKPMLACEGFPCYCRSYQET
ncbi:major facilitator superfamily domain-containing protein 6-A-like isoform X1 [Penaeus chinensis]|uniref:major facilitator superfamily domain-containing protein 6-A-like isoform X1 n=2 Tax=Penaeus chinensis TaxID=139456 RepID=UPI001FB823EC|nr:major facilitator superfamily domain-containing protein 6-A-like isoform X1 [Penaeus chinensis]XP_047496054.1 major facilitator superfamily domain-containing protein 6-A-like isoform X1 [Penaeus chinensis]